MQYLIRVICDESEDFRRDLLINDDATFLDLSHLLLTSCGYPDDQMTSFYLCNDEWERGEQITREDVSDSAVDRDVYTMADTELSEFFDNGVRHFEYCFDPFNDRVFSLSVRDEPPGSGEPEIVRSVGAAPVQIGDIDFGDTILPSTGSTDDFDDFGITSYNSDELDLEGFEISDTPDY